MISGPQSLHRLELGNHITIMAIVTLTMFVLITTLIVHTLTTLKICAKPKHGMVREHTLNIVIGKPQKLAFCKVLASL